VKADAVYILDHTALEAFWGLRDGRETVEDIFSRAKKQYLEIYVTAIDMGKAYREMTREQGKKSAREALQQIEEGPAKTVVINKKIAVEAMELAMNFGLDYPDAFPCAMSVITEGILVTAKQELTVVEDELELLLL